MATISKPNVTVNLLNDQMEVIATGVTDANGRVNFESLPVGVYRVQCVPPTGHTWYSEHADNAIIDANAANNDIDMPFTTIIANGVDVSKDATSTVTFVVDQVVNIGFWIDYTPGVGMTIKLYAPIAVEEETIITLNWSLKAIDGDLQLVQRHAGMQSTFTIPAGQQFSDAVVVSNGFDDGVLSGLSPAPVAEDLFYPEQPTVKPSIVAIDTANFALGSLTNWKNNL